MLGEHSHTANMTILLSLRGTWRQWDTASTRRIDAEMGEIWGVDVGAGGTLTSTAQPSPPFPSRHLEMSPLLSRMPETGQAT